MSTSQPRDRKPKRARKKERRNTRREEWMRAVRKRRRQRWGVFLGSLAVIAAGLGIAWLAFDGDEAEDRPDTTPTTDTVKPPINKPVACGGKVPKTAGSQKTIYSRAADQNLDPDETYVLTLETSCGDIEIELDVEDSPKTTNSVAFLARKKFYDGLFFHRIVPDFVIQGGDPQGDGTGGVGYDVVEPPSEDTKYTEGIVAMAKGGADPAGTSGSQFFIVSGEGGESLPPEYAVLGKVVKGMDVVAKIAANPGGDGPEPPERWTYIERATIDER